MEITCHELIEESDMQEARVRAEVYRNRAAELRAIAETDYHMKTHRTLMEIANEYDRMAQNMEDIAQSVDLLKKV